jgi:hypothetical protein
VFRSNPAQYKTPQPRCPTLVQKFFYFLESTCQLVLTLQMKAQSRSLHQVLNQATPTPASLLSHDAAHIFDNAAVEFQLSADREDMVAPGTIDNMKHIPGFVVD